ncbi:hypothetical protein [Leptospira alstonii]|uniref:Uncharacterized protein n=1 Tax=Leptospira alstonii serovar Sichuan str. 79601 TaxID=1218565 RepID=M6CYC8_9LEPT|nr:hypothetical protein [Leptospira alstonii]AGS80535.1 hypothetical protein LEP1GSC193_0731 [Leptospira phage vB_LalZ_80412-LE1]EMJ95486.1 hypothetical protein LEP1GSC194_3531 [Leptospira alstonii serovar Sichuan str. 79601]
MNQDLIFQQIGQLSQIARNKGRSESEAASDAYNFVRGLLFRANELFKKYPTSNKDLLFHQMSTQGLTLFHTNDNQEEILDLVSKSVSSYADMSRSLAEEFSK